MNIIQTLGEGLSYIMMFGWALLALCLFASVLLNDIARKKDTRR
jgi:hypothetical protein